MFQHLQRQHLDLKDHWFNPWYMKVNRKVLFRSMMKIYVSGGKVNEEILDHEDINYLRTWLWLPLASPIFSSLVFHRKTTNNSSKLESNSNQNWYMTRFHLILPVHSNSRCFMLIVCNFMLLCLFNLFLELIFPRQMCAGVYVNAFCMSGRRIFLRHSCFSNNGY